jgi:hypothetical protein
LRRGSFGTIESKAGSFGGNEDDLFGWLTQLWRQSFHDDVVIGAVMRAQVTTLLTPMPSVNFCKTE